MKLLLIVTISLSILVACTSKSNTSEQDVEDLMLRTRLYDSAMVHQDTGALKKLYAEDYRYTNADGRLLTRDQQLTSLTTSEMKWESGQSEGVEVKLYNNTAVVTGTFAARGTYRGNPLTINERYTAVWIKQNNEWKKVAEQVGVVK